MAGSFSDARNERDRAERERGNRTQGGAATAALTRGLQAVQSPSFTQAPANAMAADKAWKAAGNRVVNGRAESGDGRGGLGGGTTTTLQQTPGSTPSFPDADAATVVEKIAAPLVPGVGAGLFGAEVGKRLTDETQDFSKPTTLFGGDPGKQRGWQPDRFKGKASMTNVGDTGSASGLSAEEREIAGRPFRAEATDALDDDVSEIPGGSNTGDIYSDVMLKDRRKPITSLKQMLETML